MKTYLFFLFFLLISSGIIAQSVTIDPQSSTSGIVNIQSTNKGVLVPNMTTLQREAIASTQKGLLVFDTNTNSFWFHNGMAWTQLINNGSSNWTPLNGNTELLSNNYARFSLGAGTNATALASGFGTEGTLKINSPSPLTASRYLSLDGNSIQARRINVLTDFKTENNLLLNPFGGNVGINTITPNATLDVNGHIMSGTFVATSARNTHTQGAYLEWNKDGSNGKTYLLNQKGSGLGGFVIGEIDNANNITERMKIDRNGAIQINGALAYSSNTVTLTSGASYESLSTFKTSYLIIIVNQATTGINLQDGFAIGQQIIVQVKTNISGIFFPLTIVDNATLTNINLSGIKVMVNNSILKLIWDGSDWQEVSYSSND